MGIKRREFIKLFGANLLTPYMLASAPWFSKAYAATAGRRKNFIAAYFPNGAYMPTDANGYAVDGSWHWNNSNGVLHEFVSKGLKNNVMILRKLRNGFSNRDPHWQNVAGFLSGKLITLDPANPRAGETIDQRIARSKNTYLKSLVIGHPYFYDHQEASHKAYSNLYTNRISYDIEGKPITPITDPSQLYNRLFATSTGGANAVNYLRSRKKSMLDVSLSDLNSLRSNLGGTGKQQLEVFTDSLRKVEVQLDADKKMCTHQQVDISQNFSDMQQSFLNRNNLLNQIVSLAFQCGLTNVASIMYAPSVSAGLHYTPLIGVGTGHHQAAHHGYKPDYVKRIDDINKIYTKVYIDLIENLKATSVLSDTLVLVGSDMADGNVHTTRNLPILLAGQGSDLKFGQEIIPSAEVPITNLHLKILQIMGDSSLTSMGEGQTLSTGILNNIQS